MFNSKLIAYISALIVGIGLFFISVQGLNGRLTQDRKPWPEFQDVAGVVISSHLFEFGTIADNLINAISSQNIKVTILEDSSSILENWKDIKSTLNQVSFLPIAHTGVWIRDFAPLHLQHSNLLSSKVALGFADLEYLLEPILDDRLPIQLADAFKSPILNIPVKLDGGNIITTASDCFLSDDFVFPDPSNKTPLQIEEAKRTKDLLQENLNCQAHFFSNAPHPHVDMYLKPINSKTLLLSEISSDLIKFLKEKDYPDLKSVEQVKEQLDQIVEQVPPHYKIVRIPMPTPSQGLFRNYANSLLLGKTVLMPSFKKSSHISGPYVDQELLEGIESLARLTYETLGFKVISIEADKIIAAGGGLHCIAITIPKQDF
jgi:agmatine/peptidylarginine deiminase